MNSLISTIQKREVVKLGNTIVYSPEAELDRFTALFMSPSVEPQNDAFPIVFEMFVIIAHLEVVFSLILTNLSFTHTHIQRPFASAITIIERSCSKAFHQKLWRIFAKKNAAEPTLHRLSSPPTGQGQLLPEGQYLLFPLVLHQAGKMECIKMCKFLAQLVSLHIFQFSSVW